MLIRSKSKWGQGILEQIDLEIGKKWVIHKSTMLGFDAGENTETNMSE